MQGEKQITKRQRRNRLRVMTRAFRLYRGKGKYTIRADAPLNIMLTAAARTIEQLEDSGNDIAIDIIQRVYYHVSPDNPRKDITAKMIYAAGNEIHKDVGVLWKTERYICDIFWKKYRRAQREQEKRRR